MALIEANMFRVAQTGKIGPVDKRKRRQEARKK